jgi:long-chain acyl-CoA synthetase
MSSIPAVLFATAKKNPSNGALYSKIDGRWTPTTWEAYAGLVVDVGRALIGLGLGEGQTLCILANNRLEWVVADVGAMAVGAVPAGIYQTCSPEEIGYILGHSEAPLVLVEDAGQLAKIKEVWADLPHLKHAITMMGADADADPRVLSWEAFLAKGEGVDAAAVHSIVDKIDPDAPATFIYTSGTTGPPKAVSLSNRNLTWTAEAAVEMVQMGADDCGISYLPLSHIAEQMFTVHAPVTAGSSVYFAESAEALPENLKEVQPTIFFGVPRVWEKIHAKLAVRLGEASGAKAHLVAWARKVGAAVCDKRNQGKALGPSLSIQYRLADKLIFGKLKPMLGMGRARICVTGAAPISSEVLSFFAGLDLPILEVYGQSEDTGPTSFNLPGATRLGTVGRPVPGVEVKIAEDGEIIVRGPNVFLGYHKNPEATAETLIDGWLHSGDLGAFDPEGYLKITGRKKDIIITSGGKNITPANIESALKDLELVSQAVLIGDARKFISALVTLDADAAARFADANSLPAEGIHEAPALIAELQSGIEARVNSKFARVEHIRKFTVLPREFTQEDGELTPTLKIKRRVVNTNWGETIEAMYQA